MAKSRGMRYATKGEWKVKVWRDDKWVVAHTGTHDSCRNAAKRLDEKVILERGSRP
jgi:hypothetical protein